MINRKKINIVIKHNAKFQKDDFYYAFVISNLQSIYKCIDVHAHISINIYKASIENALRLHLVYFIVNATKPLSNV